MKKIFSAIAAILFLLPAVAQDRQNKTFTRFEGEKITGVSAGSGFEVKLVKSDRTKAVVEIDTRLEEYLSITLDSEGVVSVGFDNPNNRFQQTLNRLFRGDAKRNLTLYLPELTIIRLSGGADLETSDAFVSVGGKNLDIMMSGGAELDGLVWSGPLMKLQASSGSEASLTHDATELYPDGMPSQRPEVGTIVLASGGSDVDITSRGARTKLAASGGAEIEIKGGGGTGEWDASGGSEIDGEWFTIGQLVAKASGAATIKANVSENLVASASGGGQVLYRGKASSVRSTGSRSGSVRPL